MANGDDNRPGFIHLPAAVFAVMVTIGFSITAAYVSDTLSTMRSKMAQLDQTQHELEQEWDDEQKRCAVIRENQNARMLRMEVVMRIVHEDKAHLLEGGHGQ